MTTLIKFIVATVLSLTLFSCNFDMNFNSGVRGNGEVVIEHRTINESFSAIKATEGLDVYLTQSDNESVSVEADGNLQELILSEVEDGVLKIYTKDLFDNGYYVGDLDEIIDILMIEYICENYKNIKLLNKVLNKLPYSQLIYEGNWVHVAYEGRGPKGDAKVMYTYTGKNPISAGVTGNRLPRDLRLA